MIRGYIHLSQEPRHEDQHRKLFQNVLGVVDKVVTTAPTRDTLPVGYIQFANIGGIRRLYVNLGNTIYYVALIQSFIATKTSDYTVLSSDEIILVDATSGGLTITLPKASTLKGKVYSIKKIDSSANTVTIDGNGTETIDGETTQVLTTQYQSLTLFSNGTSWFIF